MPKPCRYYYRGRCLYPTNLLLMKRVYCCLYHKECSSYAPKSKLRSNILFKTHLYNVDQILLGNRNFYFQFSEDYAVVSIQSSILSSNLSARNYARADIASAKNYASYLYNLTRCEDVLTVARPDTVSKVVNDVVRSTECKYPFQLKTKWGKVIVLDDETALCLFNNITLFDFLGFIADKFAKFEFIGCKLHPALTKMLHRVSEGGVVRLRDLAILTGYCREDFPDCNPITLCYSQRDEFGNPFASYLIGGLNIRRRRLIDMMLQDKWVVEGV